MMLDFCNSYKKVWTYVFLYYSSISISTNIFSVKSRFLRVTKMMMSSPIGHRTANQDDEDKNNKTVSCHLQVSRFRYYSEYE